MSTENRWAVFASENMVMAEAAHQLHVWNQVCLHAHHAATQFLKAFLAQRHRPIPQVKHLAELLALCAEADHELERFEDGCYTLDRYLIPLTYADAIPSSQASSLPTEKDASEALAIAQNLRDALHIH